MDKIIILYNHENPFIKQPVPIVGLGEASIYYGEKWAQREELSLNGQLTGCTFNDIHDAYGALISGFAENYKSLEIWQEENGISGKVFQKDLVEVNSINVSNQRWIGALTYDISLSCYPSGYFSGAFGILEPVNNWSFEEQENEVLNVRHEISCKGFNTSSLVNNALENAKRWATDKTGFDGMVSPIFINGLTTGNFGLISQTERIDRFNGTYSIDEIYTNDLTRTGYGVVRYATSFDSGNEGISVNLQGEVVGWGQNIGATRSAFNALDKFAIALRAYNDIFNLSDLNPIALRQEINEDAYESKILFNYSFDNSNLPESYFDYTVNLNSGDGISVSIGGQIVSRGGDAAIKFQKSKAFADTVSLYNLAAQYYSGFYPNASAYPLNPKASSSGISFNEYRGEVSLNAVFNDFEQVQNGLDSFDYAIKFVPQMVKFNVQEILNGGGSHSVVDLGYANRAAININGTSRINKNTTSALGVEIIKQKCQQLFSTYGRYANAFLEQKNINFASNDERLVSFDFTWSFDSPNKVNPGYSTIDTLTV